MNRIRTALLLAPLFACAEPSGPILQADFEARYVCRETEPLASVSPLQWRDHDLASAAGGFRLARRETDLSTWTATTPQSSVRASILVTGLSRDGAETERRVLAEDSAARLDQLGFATTPSGWVVAYRRGSELRFARYDGATLEDEALGAIEAGAARFQLAPRRGGGWWLAWGNYDPARAGEVRGLRIDGEGRVSGGVETLVSASDATVYFTLTSDGLAWVEARASEDLVAVLRFAPLDGSGEVGSPRTIRTFERWELNFDDLAPALARHEDTYVLAWSESTIVTRADGVRVAPRDLEDRPEPVFVDLYGAHRVVWLARLDDGGELLGEPRPLDVAEVDREQAEPKLFAVAGGLGLIWSQGSIIYNCSGCRPDHDLRLMILDPERLDPQSTPIDIAWDDDGGLLGLSIAVDDDAIALVTDVRFHVSRATASGFATCTE